tara:strand:+ start:54 stop:863 length:810 start_codon:yes stop_codon:yes gene_type:complete
MKISKSPIIDKHGLCINEYKNNKNNAEVYFKRAVGISPEMEVSKAMANVLKNRIKKNDKILDVGCASGHFYRSLKSRINKNFYYTGVDPYKIFLKKANIAWKNDRNSNFIQGNIYKLPLKKKNYDISFCSNVFIHLNDIVRPLKELIRVTKRLIVIRTVVYDVSYKIQLVYNNKWWNDTNVKPINEFDKKGNPRAFSYFNIHSFDYLRENIKKISPNSKIKFIKDNFFDTNKITSSSKNEKRPLATKILGKEQISGCIMQPHYFLVIKL